MNVPPRLLGGTWIIHAAARADRPAVSSSPSAIGLRKTPPRVRARASRASRRARGGRRARDNHNHYLDLLIHLNPPAGSLLGAFRLCAASQHLDGITAWLCQPVLAHSRRLIRVSSRLLSTISRTAGMSAASDSPSPGSSPASDGVGFSTPQAGRAAAAVVEHFTPSHGRSRSCRWAAADRAVEPRPCQRGGVQRAAATTWANS